MNYGFVIENAFKWLKSQILLLKKIVMFMHDTGTIVILQVGLKRP